MEVAHVTTNTVEAPEGYVSNMSMAFDGAGSIDQQPCFKPVARRDLMAAVNTAARDLGLRPSSVMVLDALLSCLPCSDPKTGSDCPISPHMLLTVFACNDTLCFRAKGITDRQLRRHLERLEQVRLIRRRDSANGKRFPVKRCGKIVAAFGLDLSPLLARSQEILSLAETRRHEDDELRGMKARILCLRQRCLSLSLDATMTDFVENVRTVMRRGSTTLHHARDLLARLGELLSSASTQQTRSDNPDQTRDNLSELGPHHQHDGHLEQYEMSGTDGQNVRHKETPNSDTKKTAAICPRNLWDAMSTVPSFYPRVPETSHELMQVLYEFGKMLRIGEKTLSQAVSSFGPARTMLLADSIASKEDSILNPDGYLMGVIRKTFPRRVGHGQLSPAI